LDPYPKPLDPALSVRWTSDLPAVCFHIFLAKASIMKRSSSGNNSNNAGGPPGTTPDTGGHRYPSYQQGGAAATLFGGYQPPVHYASDQTKTLEDATKTFYEADETAGNVLQKMTAQRQQISLASGNVWEMRTATEAAKREIQALQKKYREKKRRLYVTIALLSVTDLLLFFRILQCRGNFFC
jgi:hypothetical protein